MRLHHAGEVEQRPAQAIDLIDDNAIDLAGFDVGHETLERGPVHVAAGEAAVVVAVGKASPAFAGLAADEGLGRLALGVEAVELLLQLLLRTLACVDGAADQGQRGTLRCWLDSSVSPFPGDLKEQVAVAVAAGDRLGDGAERGVDGALEFKAVGQYANL
jgi:hypothetical protein